MWVANSEGAKFWLHVLTELKNRGVRDIFIGCVDGLKGFPEAMEAVFPATQVQLCLVHMVRHSLNYVGWKERKASCSTREPGLASAAMPRASSSVQQVCTCGRSIPGIGGRTGCEPVAISSRS